MADKKSDSRQNPITDKKVAEEMDEQQWAGCGWNDPDTGKDEGHE
jgi:hypothetical protein